METVTFNHFSEVSWVGVPFVMSLTAMLARRTIGLLSLLVFWYGMFASKLQNDRQATRLSIPFHLKSVAVIMLLLWFKIVS